MLLQNVRRIVAVFGIAIRVNMKLTLITGVWRSIGTFNVL